MRDQGVICINKPMGWTSHDVVAAVRRRLRIKRVGHTGTLDPMATGVLPVVFGRATRMIEYYDSDLKSYRAEMQLGVTTDTLDITGEVTGRFSCSGVTEAEVRDALLSLTGEIMQTPPKYSAVRVGGKRLYEYARKGIEVEIKPRRAYIDDIYNIAYDPETGIASFDCDCAKGTYIRSLCDDAGRKLGCGAAMTRLIRTASGPFKLSGAVSLEELLDMTDSELDEVIIPVEETLVSLGEVTLRSAGAERYFANGREVSPLDYEITGSPFVPVWMEEGSRSENVYRVVSESGEFMGTGRIESGTDVLCADKVTAER